MELSKSPKKTLIQAATIISSISSSSNTNTDSKQNISTEETLKKIFSYKELWGGMRVDEIEMFSSSSFTSEANFVYFRCQKPASSVISAPTGTRRRGKGKQSGMEGWKIHISIDDS